MTRRVSFALLLGCIVGAALLASQSERTAPFDVLLRGGRVLDGTGNPWMHADIGVRGDRIAAMGSLGDAPAVRVIDVSGLTVTPGFIDTHSHAGPGLAGSLNAGIPLLAQGLTTVVVNPDGGGEVDLAAQRANYERRGVGVNVAMFAPHGSIREAVLGMSDRDPTAAELDRMIGLVRAGMKAGAIGLSTGLYYAPGSYARTEEVIALARVAGEAGGVYSSHIRDEGDYSVGVVAAVKEVIRIADEGHLPAIVSHMKALGRASWGLSMALTTQIDLARDRGLQVFADQYPYEGTGTSIVGALVPRWAEVGGRDALVTRLSGPDRARLAADVRTNIARRGGPSQLLISRFVPDPRIEGRTLADLATAAGKPPEDVALDLLARQDASLVSFVLSEPDIVQIMKQPYSMTCTDGDLVPMGEGKPHPRAYGAFARKLRIYVRERGVLDWATAVRSMTSLPATVFGMKDRGVLRPGARADILAFNPETIGDKATYQDPHQLSEGIVYTLVNGQLARDHGTFTGKLAGTIVVPSRF